MNNNMLGIMETEANIDKLADSIMKVLRESGASYREAERAMEIAEMEMGEMYYPKEKSGHDEEETDEENT